MTATHDAPGDRPLVSVVMAAHNAEAFIGQALASMLGQTLRDLEVIVVDDASTDATAELVRGFDDARVVLVSLPANRGAAAARNVALTRTRGAYVAIMDADDVSRPDRLALQVEFLERHPGVDVVGAQIRVIDTYGRVVARRVYPQGSAAIMRAMPRWNPMAHSTVMARSPALSAAGGYDEQAMAAHDYALWSKLARSGAVFANLPDALVDYRIHGGAIKTTLLRESLRNTLAVQQRYWADHRGLVDRLYRGAERSLLRLPAGFVNAAFVLVRYRLPTAGAALRARACARRRSAAAR